MPATAKLGSGTTVVLFDKAVTASVDVRGGGPGTRETALLDPAQTVEGIDAIVLSGGSAFGLDAASGAQAYLRENGRGFRVRDAVVPIVPAAIMFDLLNGGDKNWGRYPPYRDFGYEAAKSAERRMRARQRRRRARRHHRHAQGRRRLGLGDDARRHHRRRARGGQRRRLRRHRRRAAFLGGAVRAERRVRRPRLAESAIAPADLALRAKGGPQENTTIAVIATDAKLSKAQCNRLAVMAQDGLARAIYPVHTPLDGDVVFAASDRRQAARRSALRPRRPRHAGGQCHGPRHRARRLRGEGPALPGRAAELEG